MTKYKWDIENIASDIKLIEKKANAGQREAAIKDLRKISCLFDDIGNFNKEKRSLYVETILQNTIKRLGDTTDDITNDDTANQLQSLKHIGYISSNIKNDIGKYKLVRNKRFFTHNTDELEVLFLIKYMFYQFDKNMLYEFQNYLESKKLNIAESKMYGEDCFTIVLRTINKAYSSVVKSKKFNYIDDILYCYFKTKLFELCADRKPSIFNQTLEIFFTYLTADALKEKGYKEFYDVKYDLYNQFKRYITDFQYIVGNYDKMKYDFNNNNYKIESSSSLFNGELVNYYSKGVSYKNMLEPFTGVYSNLLAVYLYQQNLTNKYKTINDINIMINNMGLISDEDLLYRLDIEEEALISLDYYHTFMNNVKDEYANVKKKKHRG